MWTSEVEEKATRVLVVGETCLIADTLAAMLRRGGCNAAPVYSGTAAIERSKVFPPDLVVADIAISDIDGIEVARRIKKAAPTCKFLFFCGTAAGREKLARVRHASDLAAEIVGSTHPEDLLAQARGPRSCAA